MVFGPAGYAQLTTALGSTPPTQATDAQVSPYADSAYQYDPQSQAVTQVVLAGAGGPSTGGQGTYTYSYGVNPNPLPGGNYNFWAVKTTETLPDGNQDIVYTNGYGEVMLEVYKDSGGSSWDTFFKYDNAGRLILEANPSAVTGYNDTYNDLLNYSNGSYQYLSNTSGLIQLTDYYTSTTATATTAGGVAGYQADVKVQQGQQGSPIQTEAWQYFAVSAGGLTVDPVATDTRYRNTDGSGAQTTSYSYSFFSGTTQIQSQTTTAPVIGSSQNGPGTGDVSTTFFDQYRNPIWTKDADGFLGYTAYDPATGAVVKSI